MAKQSSKNRSKTTGKSSLGDNWDPRAIGRQKEARSRAASKEQICGAKLKGKDGRCTKPAGWGTAHIGTGACRYHGGNVASHSKANAVPQLEMLVGHRVNVDPLTALLLCVRIGAAEVMYFSSRIAQLETSELIEEVFWGKQLNIWIRERQKAVERLAKHSKMALDAGVQERQVQVAEQMGQQLARLIDSILHDGELELTPVQIKKAGPVVRRHLYALQGGAA